MRKRVFSILIALVLVVPLRVLADREIPDDNLAYPVLLSLNTGLSGSGFFLNAENKTYLVTAAHVLFNETTGELRATQVKLISYSKDPNESKRNIFNLNLPTLLETKRIRKHSTKDVMTIYIADKVKISDTDYSKMQFVEGISVIEKAPLGTLGVSIKKLKHFDDVLTANTIYLFGYPTSLGIKEITQLDPLRPLLRFGIVAGKNPTHKTIILDCPSYPGNSGGPVLEVEQIGIKTSFRVIGVVIEFVPFTEIWLNTTTGYQNVAISNSGYTIAASVDSVLELINSP